MQKLIEEKERKSTKNMQGNLALQLILKGQDLQELIQLKSGQGADISDKLYDNVMSKEELTELTQRFTKENGEEMQPHEVPGYYTRKVKYQVVSVNEFIKKLRRTAVCDKFFQKNNLNFCGLRDLFNKLFEVLRIEL